MIENEEYFGGQFCDAILQVGDVHFPVHKIILCKCSQYFLALFIHQATPIRVFHITDVSPAIMKLIIDYAYTSSVDVTGDNVRELMLTADMLNIMGIVKVCSDFICENLCPQNCIGFWQFTDMCLISELRLKAFDHIMAHFEGAIHFGEYLQLPLMSLAEILSKDELMVKNERTLFDVILCWIAHIPEEREKHMPLLLSQVRLARTSIEYIDNIVMANQLVRLSPECQRIVSISYRMMCFLTPLMSIPLKSCLRDIPARPRLADSIILVSGGKKGSHITRTVEAYDHLVDRWVIMRDKLNVPRAFHGNAFLDGYVYIIGGSNLLGILNSVSRLDVRTHTWQEMMYMQFRRCDLSIIALNGFIYAIGGFDGYVCLHTVERYCPKMDRWTVIASMTEGRRSAGCATLDGKIYMCGGSNQRFSMKASECYDPETNQWTQISPMIISRCQHKAVGYNKQLYAIGGITTTNALHSFEVYSPETNSWSFLCPMMIPRRNFCLEVIDDRFYVIAGSNYRTFSYHAEVYDPHVDRWFPICDSKISFNGRASCVVSGVPNMAHFAYPRDCLPHYQDLM